MKLKLFTYTKNIGKDDFSIFGNNFQMSLINEDCDIHNILEYFDNEISITIQL